jgi:Branched-chain amino acid ATP-binding cassette transporter
MSVCDTIAVLDFGKLIAFGPPLQVQADPAVTTAYLGVEEPGAEEPGAETPGAEEPGAEEPGAEEPGAEEPGAEEPGAEEPHG